MPVKTLQEELRAVRSLNDLVLGRLASRLWSRRRKDRIRHRGMSALGALLDRYASGVDAVRDRIRDELRPRGAAGALGILAEEALARLRATGHREHLWVALLALSIADDADGGAALLPMLGELVLASETHGLDPGPTFQQVARLSSTRAPDDGRPSVADLIGGFFHSVYFHVTLPRQRVDSRPEPRRA